MAGSNRRLGGTLPAEGMCSDTGRTLCQHVAMPTCSPAGRSTCGLDHMRAGASRTFEALERLSGSSDPSRKPSQSFRTPPGQPIGQGAGIRPGQLPQHSFASHILLHDKLGRPNRSRRATTSTRQQAHVRACPLDGTSTNLPTKKNLCRTLGLLTAEAALDPVSAPQMHVIRPTHETSTKPQNLCRHHSLAGEAIIRAVQPRRHRVRCKAECPRCLPCLRTLVVYAA